MAKRKSYLITWDTLYMPLAFNSSASLWQKTRMLGKTKLKEIMLKCSTNKLQKLCTQKQNMPQ